MSARPMHAVMVTPSASGGHARYAWELMTALRAAVPRSDLRLTLLTSSDLDPEFRTAQYEIADVLPPLRHRSTFASSLKWAASRIAHYMGRDEAVLRWVRAQDRIDVLHYQEPPFISAVHFARVCGAGPSPVATVHNLHPHRYRVEAARGATEWLARLGWRQCAALFVHSPCLRDQLARYLGVSAPPIVAIPHGVWTGHRPTSHESRPGGHLLLFGKMRRNKGLHLMLDAMRLLPGKRLVLAGAFDDQSFAREISTRIASENLDVVIVDRVIPEAEVADLFSGAAVAVLPYAEFHAQSGVLHLAIAYGVPAVVTDVGALGEQVRREGIGAVATAGNPGEFARTVLNALEPHAYESARRNSLRLAATLSWSAAAELTFDTYGRLRAERGGRVG